MKTLSIALAALTLAVLATACASHDRSSAATYDASVTTRTSK